MTPSGGKRPGAGKPRRAEPKSKPIWCGQMSDAERQLIIAHLTPEERGRLLLEAATLRSQTNVT